MVSGHQNASVDRHEATFGFGKLWRLSDFLVQFLLKAMLMAKVHRACMWEAFMKSTKMRTLYFSSVPFPFLWFYSEWMSTFSFELEGGFLFPPTSYRQWLWLRDVCAILPPLFKRGNKHIVVKLSVYRENRGRESLGATFNITWAGIWR